LRSVLNFVCGPADWRAAFSKLYFWVDVHRGRVLARKFEKLHNWAKPSPRFNPVIMHRTITGILRKIREIEASSMGVETLRGHNLHRPSGCNSKTSRIDITKHGNLQAQHGYLQNSSGGVLVGDSAVEASSESVERSVKTKPSTLVRHA
jgi:hypothetical protein